MENRQKVKLAGKDMVEFKFHAPEVLQSEPSFNDLGGWFSVTQKFKIAVKNKNGKLCVEYHFQTCCVCSDPDEGLKTCLEKILKGQINRQRTECWDRPFDGDLKIRLNIMEIPLQYKEVYKTVFEELMKGGAGAIRKLIGNNNLDITSNRNDYI